MYSKYTTAHNNHNTVVKIHGIEYLFVAQKTIHNSKYE